MDLKIRIEDFDYDLPDERIAKYPLEKRDSSKLLIFKDNTIEESEFRNLSKFIPAGSMMVFNDTKVVPARLFFKKTTGANIEIFCLEPFSPSDYAVSFATTGECEWKCVIGNAKKWKEGEICLDNHTSDPAVAKINLRAVMTGRGDGEYTVKFIWDSGCSFSEVLSVCGNLPIPPYLHRETEALDLERYQTLYATYNGSVAAPTAGLHFTENVLEDLRHAGIKIEKVCLHVGAGTFLPVKSEYVDDHKMHREVFIVKKQFLADLHKALSDGTPVISVGTTSTRTLESLYYMGAKLIEDGQLSDTEQWDPYNRHFTITPAEAIMALYRYLDERNLESLTARTRIIIVPVYEPKIVDILVTNFHQPQSTLLLLIGAFVGDSWKDIYRYAMDHGFRFLSYGDSSLLYRKKKSRP